MAHIEVADGGLTPREQQIVSTLAEVMQILHRIALSDQPSERAPVLSRGKGEADMRKHADELAALDAEQGKAAQAATVEFMIERFPGVSFRLVDD